ncbi:MAG: FecR domain-containing protein [Saprospiraceae bacterium]|nr:FecR domain-containing protein [Saprospiraceae bacterium]
MAYDENIYAKIVSGELSESEIDRLRTSGEWDEIQEILEVADTLELPSHNKQVGYEKLLKKRNDRSSRTLLKVLRPMVLGLAALLVCVLGYLFLFDSTVEIAASNGETANVILPDNSTVVLNAGSKLTYSKSNKRNKKRVVELIGEGLFKVQTGNTFIVETDKGRVEVLGTEFNVRTWSDRLEVECYEGSVLVDSGEESVVIKKGQGVFVISDGINSPREIENSGPFWKDGVSRFQNIPIKEVFSELERQYNMHVTLPNLNGNFNGRFGHDNLKVALEDICLPLNLSFTITEDKNVIISE